MQLLLTLILPSCFLSRHTVIDEKKAMQFMIDIKKLERSKIHPDKKRSTFIYFTAIKWTVCRIGR